MTTRFIWNTSIVATLAATHLVGRQLITGGYWTSFVNRLGFMPLPVFSLVAELPSMLLFFVFGLACDRLFASRRKLMWTMALAVAGSATNIATLRQSPDMVLMERFAWSAGLLLAPWCAVLGHLAAGFLRSRYDRVAESETA